MKVTVRPQKPVGNLPAEFTGFVGRGRLIAEAKRQLRRGRLLTLTGAPGAGKTRLALRVAAQVGEALADGAWLVELAVLTDDTLLGQTIADVLGIQEQSGLSPVQALTHHLEDKKLLLVLDNCHHMLDACATLVSKLLATAPGLRIMATSREILRVEGEHLLKVPPLSLPDPDRPTMLTAARHEAVRLFVQRASVTRPGFSVNAGNRTTIVRLCRRLDGIPLAIELAALRVGALSPAQILDRLDDYFEFLAGGSRIAVPRLQPLDVAIDWSFNLCSERVQQLWMRASVFTCGFDLETAETVCSGNGIAREAVLDLITELLDKSIITMTRGGTVARYRMLEPIRQYGLGKLRQADEEEAARRRHRDYYLGLAEQGDVAWFGAHQVKWFSRLRAEHINLRSALAFCLTTPGEEQTGLYMATALRFYWIACGFSAEGRHWLERVLALNPGPTPLRAKALWLCGRMIVLQGDIPAGVSMLEDCRTLARQLRDGCALAYGTQMLGVAKLLSGDMRSAVLLLEEAVARFETNHELNSTTVLARIHLSLTYIFRGDLDRAVSLCRQARAICDDNGELWALSYVLHVLAVISWRRDEYDEAAAHARRCLRLKRTFNDILGLMMSMELMAWVAAAEGAAERAAVLLGAVQRTWRTVGLPLFGSEYFMTPHEVCETRARLDLGDEGFTAAFDRGWRLVLEDAIAYALEAAG